jgi:homoserine kinase
VRLAEITGGDRWGWWVIDVVRVVAPASIANLGPLFDLAALAVSAGYDVVEARLLGGSSEPRVDLFSLSDHAPSGPANTAWRAAMGVLREAGERVRVLILLRKGVPAGMGLGSSGASAAAAAWAVNLLLGEPLTREQLVRVAGEAERVSAGQPHYDNAAASLLGGLVVLLDRRRPWAVRLPVPPGVRVVLFMPRRQVLKIPPGKPKTAAMREVLPRHVELEVAVDWVEKALALSLGVSSDPLRALSSASYGGPVESARGSLIPGYWEAKRAALEAGALAFNISGAGPTLFAIVREGDVPEVSRAVGATLSRFWGHEPIVVEAGVDGEGARQV